MRLTSVRLTWATKLSPRLFSAAAGRLRLFSDGLANSDGVQSGFFGPNAEEVVGTYQFQIGQTRAAGAFGATLQ